MLKPSPGGRRSCERVAPVTEQLSFQELLLLKSVEAGEAATKDEGVDFVRALIGVD
jgi:hypothetical protein